LNKGDKVEVKRKFATLNSYNSIVVQQVLLGHIAGYARNYLIPNFWAKYEQPVKETTFMPRKLYNKALKEASHEG
jgi:hypothetical protein